MGVKSVFGNLILSSIMKECVFVGRTLSRPHSGMLLKEIGIKI